MDLLVELAISWLVLWLAQNKGLSVLGIMPNRTGILQLLIGFSGGLSSLWLQFLLTNSFLGKPVDVE